MENVCVSNSWGGLREMGRALSMGRVVSMGRVMGRVMSIVRVMSIGRWRSLITGVQRLRCARESPATETAPTPQTRQ